MCKNKLSIYVSEIKMTILSILNTKNVKNWSGSPIKDFGDDGFSTGSPINEFGDDSGIKVCPPLQE